MVPWTTNRSPERLSDVDNGTLTPTQTSSIKAPTPIFFAHRFHQYGLAPARKKMASLFLDSFRGVTVRHKYWNKWIASDVWVNIINSHYDISDNLKFSSTQLNRDLNDWCPLCLDNLQNSRNFPGRKSSQGSGAEGRPGAWKKLGRTSSF